MQKTKIGWCDYSVNPFKMRMPDGTLINVCIHKSDGCRFCYAESLVRRWWHKDWGEFPGYTAALLKIGSPVLVDKELLAVLRLNDHIAKGEADPHENKMFWNDMTDEFLDFWPDEFIDKCWAVRALTPNLIHQVLTKRIDRARDYISRTVVGVQASNRIRHAINEIPAAFGDRRGALELPLFNVHLGVSAEDQKTADERIPQLLDTPAATRFVSYEPALGEVNFENYLYTRMVDGGARHMHNRLDWGIGGGESGAGHRPIPDNARWIERAVLQFRAAGVPFYAKQDSGPRPGKQGRIPDAYWVHEFPV